MSVRCQNDCEVKRRGYVDRSSVGAITDDVVVSIGDVNPLINAGEMGRRSSHSRHPVEYCAFRKSSKFHRLVVRRC